MRPRVGFLGVGWIGRHRMEAMLSTGAIEAAAVCDPSPDMCDAARAIAPDADVVPDLDALLALGLDGAVIATPSALHAEQAIRCLEAGASVFCQKPLGRDASEVGRVVDAARRADRLLRADFSYRRTRAMDEIARLVRAGALGRVFAIDLVFHNAYGPDKPWFYERAQAGGGCLMDLGSHLVDLAHWTMGGAGPARDVAATLLCNGARLDRDSATVEDYATASFAIGDGVSVRLACSWRLHAGRDAVIEAAFYGTEGGAALRNIGGSFYDFEAVRFRGTACETLTSPPDAWGGRTAIAWANSLAMGARFDAEAEDYVTAARTLDRIYAAAGALPAP